MRIGMVTGEYPPLQGGVGAFTRELARALVAIGQEVYVFTRAGEYAADADGVDVARQVEGAWGWQTLPAIHRWAAAHRLDVVNLQFQTAAYNMHPAIHWLPARLATPPAVVTFHDLRFPYLFPKAGPLRTRVVQKLARDADGAIATNRADEARLREWGVESVVWIPIGSNVTLCPPDGYERAAWRRRLGAGPDDLLISYFGFLNQSKGATVLVEALARLVAQGVPARLLMIGGRAGASDPTNHAYAEQVDRLIAQHRLGERVHFTGFVEDSQVSAHFLASDLAALPYLDGVSLRRGTLMAALAHGRAIVTTQPQTPVPELEQVVETVPAGDATALAAAMERLWRAPERRAQLEAAARVAADDFRWDTIARRTVEFFKQLR